MSPQYVLARDPGDERDQRHGDEQRDDSRARHAASPGPRRSSREASIERGSRSRRTGRTPSPPASAGRRTRTAARRRTRREAYSRAPRVRWLAASARQSPSVLESRIGNAVDVREPGEHAAVEQRQRRAVLAAVPQQTGRGADVLGKAFRPDVQVPHVSGCDERCLVCAQRRRAGAPCARCRRPAVPASATTAPHTSSRAD